MINIKYEGCLLQIIDETFTIPGTGKTKTFEMARRAPGVRAILVKDNKILLSHEYRYDLKAYDYRLPGGKVFDTLNDFKKHLDDDHYKFAEAAVIKEVLEEVGLAVKNPKLFKKSISGSSIVWDLYYFEITDIEQSKQNLEEGELIDGINWYTFDQIKQMAVKGEIHEDRTLGVLFKYILTKERK